MKCNRCNQESRITMMSMFNLDTICIPCKEIELNHPRYQEALDREREEVEKGNMNYPGIGKPADL